MRHNGEAPQSSFADLISVGETGRPGRGHERLLARIRGRTQT